MSAVKPRIGYLPLGYKIYWPQFPGLYEGGVEMARQMEETLRTFGEVFTPGLVDTPETSAAAGKFFAQKEVDILLAFPVGYCPGMTLVPAVAETHVPIRLLNSHRDATCDYTRTDTMMFLDHSAPCCIPEFAGSLKRLGKRFRVRTGWMEDARFLREVKGDVVGAAAARQFRQMKVGLIGSTYTGMTDMPTDEHRILASLGRLLVRPEVEEVVEAYRAVTDAQLQAMLAEFRSDYDVDRTVTDEHTRFSAQVAVALEAVIRRHGIDAFGFYWWGRDPLVTQIRAQAALGVTRLTTAGIPGVTEGDVKSAMAMKMVDLVGADGMFVEFFAVDHAGDFLLMGHDGPGNLNMACGRPRLINLDVLHGKTGHGIGIDYDMRPGPATLLNLTQFYAGDRFKMIYTVVDVVEGDALSIGNPNCRVKPRQPTPEFFDAWCQQGPSHHVALGYGDVSVELEALGETLGFEVAFVGNATTSPGAGKRL